MDFQVPEVIPAERRGRTQSIAAITIASVVIPVATLVPGEPLRVSQSGGFEEQSRLSGRPTPRRRTSARVCTAPPAAARGSAAQRAEVHHDALRGQTGRRHRTVGQHVIDEILLASRLDIVKARDVDEEVQLLTLATEECSRYEEAELEGEPVAVRGDSRLLRLLRSSVITARGSSLRPVLGEHLTSLMTPT